MSLSSAIHVPFFIVSIVDISISVAFVIIIVLVNVLGALLVLLSAFPGCVRKKIFTGSVLGSSFSQFLLCPCFIP